MDKIKYPIKVNKIEFPKTPIRKENIISDAKTGSWVAVRPCAEKYKGKTFLGIFIADLPVGCGSYFYKEDNTLEFYLHLNPAIYVPEIKDIIFGCGSWWHILDKPEDLKKITNKTINNIWYVKALKELSKKHGKK